MRSRKISWASIGSLCLILALIVVANLPVVQSNVSKARIPFVAFFLFAGMLGIVGIYDTMLRSDKLFGMWFSICSTVLLIYMFLFYVLHKYIIHH